jgi:hypothetical protein
MADENERAAFFGETDSRTWNPFNLTKEEIADRMFAVIMDVGPTELQRIENNAKRRELMWTVDGWLAEVRRDIYDLLNDLRDEPMDHVADNVLCCIENIHFEKLSERLPGWRSRCAASPP